MPWPRCSRIGFRKSRADPGLILVFLLVSGTAAAEFSHEARILVEPQYFSVSVTASGADAEQLYETVREGLRVQMEYRIRVSRPRAPLFRIFGDRLVREFRPIVTGHWDPYLSAYVVTGPDGGERTFQTEAEFYDGLFALNDYRIPWSAARDQPELRVELSARYTPVVFVPGLSILSLFTSTRRQVSAWQRHEIQMPESGE